MNMEYTHSMLYMWVRPYNRLWVRKVQVYSTSSWLSAVVLRR